MAKAWEYYVGGILCLIISAAYVLINNSFNAGVIAGVVIALVSFVQGYKSNQ